MPAVTVGMPVYNGEAYLDKALAALSAQDFQDMEILISDNASTDRTAEIISGWAARDKRIVHVRQPANIGAVPNYDFLLQKSQSPWFMFAAYDDLWSPQYVGTLYRAITARPGLRHAAPHVVLMNEDEVETGRMTFPASVNTLPKLASIRALLRTARGPWFYGLYSRQHLLPAWQLTKEYRHTWGIDFVTILPFLLSGTTTGDDTAVFRQRETGLSVARYRPATARAGIILYANFLKCVLKALRDAPLTLAEKIVLLPSLANYLRHGEKLKRILRLALRGKLA